MKPPQGSLGFSGFSSLPFLPSPPLAFLLALPFGLSGEERFLLKLPLDAVEYWPEQGFWRQERPTSDTQTNERANEWPKEFWFAWAPSVVVKSVSVTEALLTSRR